MDKDKSILFFSAVVAATYIALKYDIIPDAIPIIGWLDDGFIAVGVLIAGIWWIRRQP
jgi:uncharacterized membrane protein YkvA (DUF1232 family)